MAREINRLNARSVVTLSKPGRHADGGGLYLVIDNGGSKRWAFLYRRDNRLREMGLGGLLSVPLVKAREAASVARAMLQAGEDPILARKSETRRVPTFGEVADEFIEAMKPQFRNAKHLAQWQMTLKEYAAPIRGKQINDIATSDVLTVLKPIWLAKPETASRLRGRIERVLGAAKAKGLRAGENPALWRGHLANLLPRHNKVLRGHHKAMDYRDIPAFMTRLTGRDAMAARALEFTILNSARSGEVFGATWGEIDFAAKIWTIPANRMKASREHRVPLTEQALAILSEMAVSGAKPEQPIFAGRKADRPLSNMAMDMLLRRMKIDVTVHGFRSSFRDWCGEETSFPREVAEQALAHVVGDMTERAYRRGDALEKRRTLMAAWANYCCPKSSTNVVRLRPLPEAAAG